MAITAAMVKELRAATGAGVMDAKTALTETGGDMEAAVDWLRVKGLARAARKSGRIASEGLVAVALAPGMGVAVEVNCETDFVAKTAGFQDLAAGIAAAALTVPDLDALATADLGGRSVADAVVGAIATLGENIALRRMARLTGPTVAAYIHNATAEGLGKIGALAAIDGADADFARQVAMHVAAARPAALTEADIDPADLDRERALQTQIARESGKPDHAVDRMIEGRMKKYRAEAALLGQPFVLDPNLTVAQAATGANTGVTGFVRLEVGEKPTEPNQ